MEQNAIPVPETRSDAIQLLAIGQATSRQIEQSFGTTGAFPTTAADSESLLALASLQEDKISGKKILIVRGEGGRETLKQQLEQRGATVQYLELYRRVSPQFDPQNPNPLPSLLQNNGIDIVTITSGQALEYLTELAEDKQVQLKALSLLAPSQRIVDIAKRSGFEKLIQSRGARDMDIVDALIQWQQSGSTL